MELQRQIKIAKTLFGLAVIILLLVSIRTGSILNCLLVIFISEWWELSVMELPLLKDLWVVGLCGGIIGFVLPQLLDRMTIIVADFYPQKPELAQRVDFACAVWRKYSALTLLISGILLVWLSSRHYSAIVCLMLVFLMWEIIGSFLDSVITFSWRKLFT